MLTKSLFYRSKSDGLKDDNRHFCFIFYLVTFYWLSINTAFMFSNNLLSYYYVNFCLMVPEIWDETSLLKQDLLTQFSS